MSRSREPSFVEMEPASEIDLRALGAALGRRRRAFVVPTLLVALAMTVFVNVVPPRYTGETQVLLENQETSFNKPDRVSLPEQILQVDQEGVASQVQLVNSPDIARQAIKELHLVGNPEFDPTTNMNPLMEVLVLLGLAHDPTTDTIDARMVKAFLDKLVVFSPPKTRVITIQFTSKDPQLAARGANLVADLYIQEQSSAKRAMAKDAADALASQMDDLRTRLAAADAERERYRLQTGLLAGSNNMTITGQQLADINSDLSKARSAQADAQAQSSMIRELLRSGKSADVPDVINNDIVRRIAGERSVAQAQLALESRSLLPGHPRIKALQAQLDAYDLGLKSAARQAAISLENQARIAATRVANLEAVLTQQKTAAGASNVDEVHLRALERTTQSLKDQLESTTTKYQEAQARQDSDATPADARIIARAARPDDPSFPKKLPFIIFATVATLFFSVGYVVASELLSGRADVAVAEEPSRSVPQSDPAPPKWVQPVEAQPREPRRSPDLLRKLSPDHEDEPDLVFAPLSGRDGQPDQPVVKARRFGLGGRIASTVQYLKTFGRSAAASRVIEAPAAPAAPAATPDPVEGVGWDVGAPTIQDTVEASTQAETGHLADRIVAAHVPGRGLHVVGTNLGNEPGAINVLLDLSRALAGRGRSIIVDLNRTPTKLAPLCGGDGDGRAKILTMNGLAELLADDCSFAEVIYRDAGSRLHFIPAGRQEADFRDFDLILDALTETYDFIMLLTPALPQSEITKVMAPYADFVVLAALTELDDGMVGLLEKELIEAGARQVLVAGAKRGVAPAQSVA